jgi:hypothetical protein
MNESAYERREVPVKQLCGPVSQEARTSTASSTSGESRVKKPYHTPRLEVYGTLREITNSVATAGSASDDFVSARTR